MHALQQLGQHTMNNVIHTAEDHEESKLSQSVIETAEVEAYGGLTFDYVMANKEALLYQLRHNLADLLENHFIYDHPFNDDTLDADEVYAHVWALQAALIETPDEYALCWMEAWIMCAVMHSLREVMCMPMPDEAVFLDHQQRLRLQLIEAAERLVAQPVQ